MIQCKKWCVVLSDVSSRLAYEKLNDTVCMQYATETYLIWLYSTYLNPDIFASFTSMDL